ncbi:MAG: copper ion binding protein [Oscillospiraceae bacterium]|jgi:copper chaperone|nr:copper ion binding protein [Oscillospiraceae bacterium]
MAKAVINVEGMSCEHCVKNVTNAASGVHGVSAVKVDLKGGTATVEYDESVATLDAIKGAIVEKGYDVA